MFRCKLSKIEMLEIELKLTKVQLQQALEDSMRLKEIAEGVAQIRCMNCVYGMRSDFSHYVACEKKPNNICQTECNEFVRVKNQI